MIVIKVVVIALYLWKVSSLMQCRGYTWGLQKIIVRHPRVISLNTPCIQGKFALLFGYATRSVDIRKIYGANISGHIRGSLSTDYEECLPGYDAVWCGAYVQKFQRQLMPPSSG